MPVLAEEPDTFPPDLLASPHRPESHRWLVAHTRPRQEKAVARQLFLWQIPYYLPCQKKRTRTRGGGVLTASVPLFSGYVFVQTAAEDRWRVMATNRVAQLIPVVEQEQLWADLQRVRGVLDLGRPVAPETKLVPGTLVTLRDGPLAGMTGTLIREAGEFRFVVRVDFIQRGVSVTVDGAWLGVVDPQRP